jgi:dTDP-glucose 4,6-dehydratase
VDIGLTYVYGIGRKNVNGTCNVVDAARQVGVNRVHYVSTDEIFGHATNGSFSEESPSAPRNPYAAGKLGGEGIVQAYGGTFGMYMTITNSVNNYGRHQSPDKLISRLTIRGLQGKTLPIYGDGKQVREWIDVRDHAAAITHVLEHGGKGERYCVGTGETHENIEVIGTIYKRLGLGETALEYVPDRKGHDIRYSVNASKIRALGWAPKNDFRDSLAETVDWYADNREWWKYYLPHYPDLQPV